MIPNLKKILILVFNDDKDLSIFVTNSNKSYHRVIKHTFSIDMEKRRIANYFLQLDLKFSEVEHILIIKFLKGVQK